MQEISNYYFSVANFIKHTAYTFLCFILLALPLSSFAESNLPDIGGPASADLSPAKEIELGRILIAEVRRNLPISNDPELSQYIHSLGTRITSGGLNSNFSFLLFCSWLVLM